MLPSIISIKKNDCFARYLFSNEGNENIVLDFINAVMLDSGFETFKSVKILNPFNLTKYLHGKESIVDVKCITEDNEVVIIEIQLQGNQSFIKRSLYYWAQGYSDLLNRADDYNKLTPVIGINVLDFVLFGEIEDIHTCYVLKEFKHNKILTDHCQLHYIELPKLIGNEINKESRLISWLKFFKGDNMSNLIKENSIFEEVEKRCQSFVSEDVLINAYKNKELNDYFNKEMIDEEVSKAMEHGIEQGIERGKSEGLKEGRISMAKEMKKDGADLNVISKYTSLSIEEIKKL